MREITRGSLIDDGDVLLFDILQELKALNANLRREVELPFEDIKGLPCKHCKGTHEKPIEIVNCGRRMKKKEAK